MHSPDSNIVAIHADSINTNINEFVKNKVFGAVPFVTYKINEEPIKECIIDRPLKLFGEGLKYGELYSVLHDDRSLIHMPSKDFDRLKKHAFQCLNRVTADLITSVVVEILLDQLNTGKRTLFFIEGVDSNKTIGRLGYLYLDNERNTVAFLSYKPQSLLTDILNTNNDSLQFDMYYFSRNEDSYSKVVPNDFRDSLTQFVLFDTSIKGSEKVLPIRCDIMSQGMPSDLIKNKVDIIKEFLDNNSNMTSPYQESVDGDWLRIPRIMRECIEYGNIITKMKAKIIMEKAYE